MRNGLVQFAPSKIIYYEQGKWNTIVYNFTQLQEGHQCENYFMNLEVIYREIMMGTLSCNAQLVCLYVQKKEETLLEEVSEKNLYSTLGLVGQK